MIGFESVEKQIVSEFTWMEKHERLILGALVFVAVVWLGTLWLNKSYDTAHTNSAIASAQLDVQKKSNAELAQQLQQTITALTQQNAMLAGQIASRDAALAQQKVADTTMPVLELLTRWQALAGTNGITSTSTGVAVPEAAARSTVTKLEEVPVLQSNLKDTQLVADNRLKELTQANGVIAGLNVQIGNQDTACKTQVVALKADARRSKLRWFGRGAVVGAGVVAYLAAHFI